MKRRVFCAIFASVIGLCLVGSPARALDEPQAAAFIDKVVKAAFAELGPPNLSIERRREIARDLIGRYSDVGQVSEGLVGRFWARATPEDRARFQKILIDYMLIGLAGDMLTDISGEPNVKIRTVQRTGERHVVNSVAQDPGADPLPIDWVIGTAADGRPVVLDVMVEGVSPLKIMKEEFNSFLYSNSGRLDALIAALQKKIDAKIAAK
jgi:phospholipid transport system substrate-binding protein